MNYEELVNQASLTKLFHKEIARNLSEVKGKVKSLSLGILLCLIVGYIPWVYNNLTEQNLTANKGILLYVISGLNLLVWLFVLGMVWVYSTNLISTVLKLNLFMHKGIKQNKEVATCVPVARFDLGVEVEFFFDINGFVSSVKVSKAYASLFAFNEAVPVKIHYGRYNGSKVIPWVSECLGNETLLGDCIESLKLVSNSYVGLSAEPWYLRMTSPALTQTLLETSYN